LLVLCMVSLCLVACTTTHERVPRDAQKQRDTIDAAVDGALKRLYAQSPAARELTAKAHAVLVFPSVVSIGFVVGASNGLGALRIGDRSIGYYDTTAASFGLVAGAESRAIYLFFMNQYSLDRFRSSNGWTVGADASITLLEEGADAGIDTRTAERPVVGYVLTNHGIMAKVSLDGAKVTELSL